jgi:metallo-beta-lactamase family protein
VIEGMTFTFRRAGHILGSASIELGLGGSSVVFSGDVGRPRDPVMKPPDLLPRCDYLIVESTYGDRRHPEGNPADTLAELVNATVERGGVVVIPAFAVGRAQHILHVLAQLRRERRIPEIPIFLDSPMSIHATRIFMDHPEDHRLSPAECGELARIAKHAPTPEDSKTIDRRSGPMIVISASGMATGGRVLHHLKQFLPDPRNLVLFVGYQTAGTRGRALLDGAEELKIQGKYVLVRARVAQIHGLSAHADARELSDWLRASAISPKRVFVTHGEPAAADAFRRRLRDDFSWNVVIPEDKSGHVLA